MVFTIRPYAERDAAACGECLYKNLSKLAAVLIKQFGCLPLEHHRRARLE